MAALAPTAGDRQRHRRPGRLARRGHPARSSARHAGVRRRRPGGRAPRPADRACPAATTWPTPARAGLLDAVGVSPEQAAPGLRAARCPAGWSPSTAGRSSSRSSTTRTSPARCARCCRRCAARPRAGWPWCSAPAATATPASARRWARVAAELADLVVVTDDNPRDEDPAAIRAAVVAGAARRGGRGARSSRSATAATAIDHAVGWARPGDVVLVAGKGHETGQTSGGAHPAVRRPRRTGRRARASGSSARDRPDRRPDRRDRRRRARRHHAPTRPPHAGSPAPSSSTRGRWPRAGCSWRCPARAPTGTTSPPPRSPRVRSRCWPRGPVGVPAIVVAAGDRADASAGRARARHRRLRAPRCSPRWPGWRPRSPRELVAGGLTVVGVTGSSGKTSTKDLLAAVLRPARRGGRPARVVQQRTRPPVDGAARRRDRPDYLVLELSAAASGQHRRAGRDRAAADRRGAQRRHRPPRRVRLPRGHRRGESRTAAGASGRPAWSILNADDPAVAAMARARPRPGWCGSSAGRRGADVRADDVDARRRWPGPVHPARRGRRGAR